MATMGFSFSTSEFHNNINRNCTTCQSVEIMAFHQFFVDTLTNYVLESQNGLIVVEFNDIRVVALLQLLFFLYKTF